MSKGNLSVREQKQLFVDDYYVTVSYSHIEVCLIHFYENAIEEGSRKGLANAFWSCLSALLSIVLMLISSNFKQIGPLASETVCLVVIIVAILLLAVTVITGCLLVTRSYKNDRNHLISDAICEMSKCRVSNQRETTKIFEFS